MKKNTIYTYSCKGEDLTIPRSEILRYMGCREETEAAGSLIDHCMPEVLKTINPRGSFAIFDLSLNDDTVCIGNVLFKSKNLSKNLAGCHAAAIFAITAGTGIDRLINKYQELSPSRALCINSAATAAIECLADRLCTQISDIVKKDNMYIRPRFSAGYGDFDLKYQDKILMLTKASALCGINLTEALMMVPVKSVTAIMGISREKAVCSIHGCEVCSQKNCNYRRQMKI